MPSLDPSKPALERAEIELRNLTSLLRQAPVGIAVLEGPLHTFSFANPVFLAIVGGRPVLGLPVRVALPEFESQGLAILLDRVSTTGKPFVGNEVLIRFAHQAQSAILNFVYSPRTNSTGVIDGVLISATDVTEQVRARQRALALAEELRESEEGLRRVIEMTRTGTWELDLVTGQITADARHREILGVGLDAPLDRQSIVEAVHFEDRLLVESAITAALAGENEGRFYVEHRIHRSDGRGPIWMESQGRVLRGGDGKPAKLVGTSLDVTERKRVDLAREQLLAERERSAESLRALSEAVPQQIWTSRPDGTLDFVNQRVLDYFGTSGQEILGAGWQSVIHPDDLARCVARWAQSLQTGADYEVEFRLRNGRGEYRWHLGRARAALDPEGQVLKWFGTNTDIDEAKRFREDLVRSGRVEQELRHEAEAANRAKDEFLAMLGHELRNPLAPIATALEVIKLRSEGASSKEHALIERQVSHLTQLIDDLLDVSRLTRGQLEVERTGVNLATVVARAIELASPLLEQRRHHLTVEVPAEGLLVRGDAMRLAQVVSNLLTNAAKYTEPGGSIRVAGTREDAEIVVRVRDSGMGISPALLPQVFDRFVQEAQSSARSRGGLGLGLTIVRALVELHGGSVSASSQGVDRGSEFTIRLPALVEVALGVRPLTPTLGNPARGAPRGQRILVVDDNVDAAEVLAEMLEMNGHEVRFAHDGPAALKIVEGFQPDLAVLDIGLPLMDGYELGRRLREMPALAGVRLIALTGYGQASDRQRSRDAGFNAHLVKPFDVDDLEKLIAAPASA